MSMKGLSVDWRALFSWRHTGAGLNAGTYSCLFSTKNKIGRIVMWKWLTKFASPMHFYLLVNRLTPWLGWGAAILFVAGVYGALFYAPADYQQGESFRIIYVHVPSAWMSMFVYMVMAAAGGCRANLENQGIRCHCTQQRPSRGFIYISCSGDRVLMGQAYVGYLVGLGRKVNIGINSAISLPWVYCIAVCY